MDWRVGAFANFVTMSTYLALAAAILGPLVRHRQLRADRFGTATALIFLTCAVHFGGHTARMVLPAFGVRLDSGLAMRRTFGPEALAWDILIALVGIYYWSLWRTYGSMTSGAMLLDDLRERQRKAFEINDGIVQGLATAKLALELDQTAVTRDALESTLASARGQITELLGEGADPARSAPGDLRRSKAALLAKA